MQTSLLYNHCSQAIARFYHSLDQRDNESLRACLEADTVWVRQGKTLKGPEQILEALDQRDPLRVTSHQFNNLFITLSEDGVTANITYYLTVYDNQHSTSGLQLKAVLRSEDVFCLKNGVWVLSSKQSHKHL
ncbi:MAG: SnoaL-like domain-containing protein [Alcaligenaceae bacterium]|nr:SnoaL-like domain-containing protein [Alcaligenaceae bacterium]